MADAPLQQFLNYPYRKWIVGGATIVLMLMISLPAYERVAQVRSETRGLRASIDEASRSVANLPALRAREAEVRSLLVSNRNTVDDEQALKLREEAVKLIHSSDCRVLSIQLHKLQSVPWIEGDNPLAAGKAMDSSTATGFELLRTQLTLSAEGTLSSIARLIDRLSKLHAFAVPTSMHVQQKGETGRLEIQVELTLFSLERSHV